MSRVGVSVCLLLVLAIAMVTGLLVTERETEHRNGETIQSLARRNRQLVEASRCLEQVRSRLSAMRGDIDPSDADSDGQIFSTVRSTSSLSGARVRSVRPDDEDGEYAISASGSVSELMYFVMLLERDTQGLRIDSVRIVVGADRMATLTIGTAYDDW